MKSSFYILLITTLAISTNISAQSWVQLNDPPFLKHHSNGFSYNGKAYIFEGINDNDGPDGISNEVWEYDSMDDSWTRLADFPGPSRAIAIGDDWNDKYYYGFGAGADDRLNDLWEFDPATMTYTELPSCPCIGRSHPALIAYNDKVYMGSGSSSEGDVDDWWEYDIVTQVWTEKTSIPGGNRHHPFFFEIGNNVYVGGGHRNNWLAYNIDTEIWTEIDNAPQGRVAGSQLSYNGLGLIIGGDDASHIHVPEVETFMIYDPTIDEWSYMPPLPNLSRWAPSSFIINDDLYFFGGLSDNNFNDASLWKFDLNILGCLPASNLNVTNIEVDRADLFWTANTEVTADTLKWKPTASIQWNTVLNPSSIYALTDLEQCQDHEYQIVNNCDGFISRSEVFGFTTTCVSSNHNNESKSSIFVSPNPSDGQLRIEGVSSSENITDIRIQNSLGKDIKRFTKSELSRVLDLSDIPIGVYFLSIFDQSKILKTLKFVKN